MQLLSFMCKLHSYIRRNKSQKGCQNFFINTRKFHPPLILAGSTSERIKKHNIFSKSVTLLSVNVYLFRISEKIETLP